MGRLKTLPPRLAAAPPRIGAPKPVDRQQAELERSRERERLQPSRKWYNSQRWKDLRVEIWKRDRWTCQKTGAICAGKYPAGNSPVADHIIPHRGDASLFWDPKNIQTVSKAYHDSQKQREERAKCF